MKIYIDGTELEFTNAVINIETNSESTPEPEPTPTPQPNPDLNIKIYDEDLLLNSAVSTSTNPVYPKGLTEHLNIEYLGSFKAYARGESNSHHVNGTLAINKDNNSIYMAGRESDDAIAEFAIPSNLSIDNDVTKIVGADPIQEYVRLLDGARNNNTITGMAVVDGQLWVNSEVRYDASGNNQEALQVLNPNDIKNSDLNVFNRVQGDAKIAGWISEIPESAQSVLGGKWLMGNAANNSINLRYSHGPSLAIFNPSSLQDKVLPTNQKMVFPYSDDGSTHITPKADDTADDNPNSLWNVLSKAVYGFVVPNSNIYMVIGTNSGYNSAIIYKDDIRYPEIKADGSIAVDKKDNKNFYWLFDIRDIANADKPHDVRPFNYGQWSHPFDKGSANVGGATYDNQTQTLYVSLKGAAKMERFDFPPMINVYKVGAK